MKRSRFFISSVFAASILLSSALAQTGTVRATIPFKFTVDRQVLPAGDYRLSINGAMLEVSRVGEAGVAKVLTNPTRGEASQTGPSRLIFHCYASRCFLSQAWIGGTQGYELFASSAELEDARTTKQDQATVLASRADK